MTQSLIPALSAIGFVQFELWDIPNNGNNGATVYVNLWTGSPNTNSASLLGSTAPVYMPNGFSNSGLGVAGITNFYFSTPLALTPGQTYYLQPVVLSGDDPWDIVTIGNTYSKGQVFEKGQGFNTDFWFREGIVVPEPTALALIALSGLLILSLKRRSRLLVLVPGMLVVSFFSSPSPAQAQTSPPQPDSVVAIVADAQGLPFVPPSQRPRGGVYWEVRAWFPSQPMPLPCPPHDPTTPVYGIGGNDYLVDGTGGELLAPTAWSFAYRALGTTNPAVVLQAEVAALQDFVAQVQARNLSAQLGLNSRTSTPNVLEGLQGGGVTFNGLNGLRLEDHKYQSSHHQPLAAAARDSWRGQLTNCTQFSTYSTI